MNATDRRALLGVLGLAGALAAVLSVLKLAGVIGWPWWAVLAPFWAVLGLTIAAAVGIALFALVVCALGKGD